MSEDSEDDETKDGPETLRGGDAAPGEDREGEATDAGPAAGTGGDDPPPAEGVPDRELAVLPPQEVRGILEALIFASPQPITPREVTQVLGGVSREEWQAALQELKAEYARDGRGLQLVEVAGGWQITTRPEYNDWVRELLDPRTPTRLSIQALETLAVVAYKQPITLPEIIELRGVKSGGVMKTLLEKRLIRIIGRKEVVGRPMLYGTTKQFLLHFGLKDLSELPRIEEFAEVLGEEVDVAGLKQAIEAPTPADVPLAEEAAGGREAAEGPEDEAGPGEEPDGSDEPGPGAA